MERINMGRALAMVGQSTQPLSSSKKLNEKDREATPVEFAAVFSNVLTLVAPTGMTKDERKAWLRVAYETLKHIPLYLLERAEQEVRMQVDHPAKIVKAVADATAEGMAWHRRMSTPIEIHVAPVEVKAVEDNTAVPFEEAKGWTMDFLNMALRQRWVTQADYDRIIAEREAQVPTDAQ